MKNPHVRPSLLTMTAFISILSLSSATSCNTKFDLPLFYGIGSVQDISSASDKILATLPEIVALGEKVSFPPDAPVIKALGILFKFLEDKKAKDALVQADIDSERAEETIQQVNAHMIEVEKKILSIFHSEVTLDVKKKDWVTAVNLCEKTLTQFLDSRFVMIKAKLATTPLYVAFATVYLTVAQLGKSLNPEYESKLKKGIEDVHLFLPEFEIGVKAQRKSMLEQQQLCNIHCYDRISDKMSRKMYDFNCRSEFRQEFATRIKKFFSQVKKSVAAFLSVPVSVQHQYYTTLGSECLYSCGYWGKPYSTCEPLDKGGRDSDYCSTEKGVTIKGQKCLNECAQHDGKREHWCKTAGTPCSWDFCSPVTIQ